MTSQKKTLFVIQVNNVVDVITNSSSELFVLKGETKSIVSEMIENIYPDYLSEYNEVKHISELSDAELNTIVSYHCYAGIYPARKSDYRILDGFTFDELYEPAKDWETGELEPPAWNGEIQYELKNNLPVTPGIYNPSSFVVDKNRDKVISAIEKTLGNYFLYSLDENPDYEMQEKLGCIAVRYHLG